VKNYHPVFLAVSIAAVLCGCSKDTPAADATGSLPLETNQSPVSTVSGVIGDSMCATNHGGMIKAGSMGSTDATCTIKCVEAGSRFVLVPETGKPYQLSDQAHPREFAGQKVEVIGSVDEKRHYIQVQKIQPYQPKTNDQTQ
jgi:hypothetical protein